MQTPPQQSQTGFNWFVLFLRCLAVPLDIIAHRGFGSRYFDLRTGAAAILIWITPLFFPSSDPAPVWCFLGFYVLMNLRARWETYRLERRGRGPHSRYSGQPLLCRWRPAWNELTVKRFIEPAIAVCIGWGAAEWINTPLGVVLIGCGLSAFLDVSSSVMVERQRRMDVRDAVLDAESLRDIRR